MGATDIQTIAHDVMRWPKRRPRVFVTLAWENHTRKTSKVRRKQNEALEMKGEDGRGMPRAPTPHHSFRRTKAMGTLLPKHPLAGKIYLYTDFLA